MSEFQSKYLLHVLNFLCQQVAVLESDLRWPALQVYVGPPVHRRTPGRALQTSVWFRRDCSGQAGRQNCPANHTDRNGPSHFSLRASPKERSYLADSKVSMNLDALRLELGGRGGITREHAPVEIRPHTMLSRRKLLDGRKRFRSSKGTLRWLHAGL